VSGAAAAAAPRWRALDAFIAAWLAVQIALPLVAGLDLSEGRYFCGPFSWSMYSHRRLRGEMALYSVGEDGERRPIDDRRRHARRLPGADFERTRFGFHPKEGGAEARMRALVDHLAATRRDGRLYVAEIRWKRTRDPDWPRAWRYEARAEAPAP
jgi:hypothetical protein